ncbi:MAG TPA: hypothetical protein VNK95_12740, partial [Caldilineaceae bacterium]|nr:hypothetical protein [Caldilineaceae bacterium]
MQQASLTRRSFLRLSAFGVGTWLAAACAPATAPSTGPEAPAAGAAGGGEAAAPPQETVVLEVVMDTPEYQNQHQQIFDLFSEEHPEATVTLITHSEDGQPAYVAKVAGGYIPAMETVWASGNSFRLNKDTYEVAVDLSTIDYPYWDLFLWDIKNTWSNIYGLPGPRCIDPYLGVVMTWQFHQDLLDEAGLNPIGNVNTWDDLKQWLEEGTRWANAADSPVDRFYDQGWLNPWFGWHLHYDTMPLAFPEGQREHQIACWKGEKAFNAEDSP